MKCHYHDDKVVLRSVDQAGHLPDVALRFTSEALEAQVSLSQNQPNPFAGETLIGFYLPEGGQATLTLTDIQGKVLEIIKGEYNRGYHEIRVSGKHLPKGVIQYTLTSGEYTATRRMVLTK